MNLHYKRIPYTTERVEFTDLVALSKQLGAQPTSKRPDGSDAYTLPIIKDLKTGQVVSDSFNIAKHLDEKYPERPLVPAGTEETQTAFIASLFPTIGVVSAFSLSHVPVY
jgi:glutathione S-transferase